MLAVIGALLAASATASADELEDPDYAPFPIVSLAPGVQRDALGIGPSLELAIGNDRWQYLGEGSISRSSKRGALGVRWLARQFAFDTHAGIELFLVATGGERWRRDGMGTTPELTVGPGIQLRGLRNNWFLLRIDARAVFTDSAQTTFLTGMTFGW